MRAFLSRAFGCDLRSLAALRIALGLLLLADLSWRLPYFGVWLTESGAWPLSAAGAELRGAWSLYFISASPYWAGALLILSAIAAVALLAGWRTRLSTIASWVLLASLQARNELPLNAGDAVLRLLLFWAAFLPLGACWSVDARRAPHRGKVASIASAALLVQVALIYVFNALYKSGDSWKSGSALRETLQSETYTTTLAPALLDFGPLLALATRFTWWLELLGPILIFCPWKNSALRAALAMMFIAFHLAIFSTLRIGLFPLISAACWLPFLPGSFWQAFRFSHPEHAPAAPASRVGPLAGCALAFVLWLNLSVFLGWKPPAWAGRVASTLRLDQRWALFAPNPHETEGWLVAVLETQDGLEYDALTGREVDWARPAHLGVILPSGQWRKFLASLRSGRFPARRRHFAEWCVREWERVHPGDLVQRVRLHYLWENIQERQSPPDNWLLFENPPGPLTELARKSGFPPPALGDQSDL